MINNQENFNKSKSNFMTKRNLIIGIVILIALVGGVVLWNQKSSQQDTRQQTKKEVAKQTQEQKTEKEQANKQNQTDNRELKPEEKIDTSNWKTYYNKNCRLQFKYPPNYHLIRYAEKPDDCNVWVTKRLGSNPGHDIRVQYMTSFAWKDAYLKCDQQSEKYKNIRWFFSCYYVDNYYKLYKKLVDKNDCDNIHIQLADKKHLVEHNVEHGVVLDCQDGNTNDAKTIKEILRSFKFF